MLTSVSIWSIRPSNASRFVGRRARHHVPFERQQLTIPPVDAHADPPSIECGNEPQHREKHDDGRHEDHEDAVYQTCRPERKVPVDKALARFVVTQRIGAYVEFMLQRGRKFTPAFEQARFSMHFLRGLNQQIGQRGMQIGPCNELDRGADQMDIVPGVCPFPKSMEPFGSSSLFK